jgi:oligopeptide/dipeptide ABC transporter ATP-binding protein
MSAAPMFGAAPIFEAEDVAKLFALKATFADRLAGRGPQVVRALDGVSLAIGRGETLGIVGESGCGKSTLARCLVRLYEPDRGTIRFEGEDVRALGGDARRRFNRKVQMVFQDPYGSLNPRKTVAETLAEPLVVHKIASGRAVGARVAELLDLVHLPPEAADRYPHEFSGGQRQRIGIARALAVEPAVIIADEPVSALDVSVQAQIVNLFLELQSRLGLSLVFITHDLRLVRHVSHRLMVMYLGKVVETGATEDLFTSARHPYTRALIEAVPVVGGAGRSRREAVKGELPSPLAPPPGCHFHPRCPIVEPRCRTVVPVLDPRGGAWPVACHPAGEPTGDVLAERHGDGTDRVSAKRL